MQTILEQKISKLIGSQAVITAAENHISVDLDNSRHLFLLENDLVKIPVYDIYDISDLELKLKIAKAIQSHVTFKNIDERR